MATLRRQAPLSVAALPLLLLLHSVQPQATEPAAGAEAAAAAAEPAIQPTRQSIYQHLAAEMKAALGAEEHIRGVFAGVAQSMRDSLRESELPTLQALVDGVLESAEDAWVAADDAGRTINVKPCVDGAEVDAQQVAKRALEKLGGCVRAVEEEGELRVREAARLLNEIEDVSKRFVSALESCIKEEEAAQSGSSSAPDAAAAAAAAAATAAANAHDANSDEAVPEAPGIYPETAPAKVGDTEGAKPKCKGCASGCKCKTSPKEETEEKEVFLDKENEVEGAKTAQPSDEDARKYENEQKGKNGNERKDNEGEDKIDTGKDENLNESVDGKVPAKGKDAGKENRKNKKIKNSEAGKDGERVKTQKSGEGSEDRREKKGRKSDKKESKNKNKEKGEESGEGRKKSRKKRDLFALNESPAQDSAAPPSGTSAEPWPSEGSTPEERRVIACMRSPTMKPLIDQKTRAYQRLQAVLQRTAAKQQDAPTCVTDHVRKAELKIFAIKQRMTSCADRKMRQEL